MTQDYKTLPYDIIDEGMFYAAYFGMNAIRYRKKNIPEVNCGEEVYEMHVDIQPADQGRGLAGELIKALLYREGGVAWFSYGRITNPVMYRVLDKIKTDNMFKVTEYSTGITVEENMLG